MTTSDEYVCTQKKTQRHS